MQLETSDIPIDIQDWIQEDPVWKAVEEPESRRFSRVVEQKEDYMLWREELFWLFFSSWGNKEPWRKQNLA